MVLAVLTWRLARPDAITGGPKDAMETKRNAKTNPARLSEKGEKLLPTWIT